MSDSFLAIDIGNTNIVCGIYNHSEWIKMWRIETSDSADDHLFSRFLLDGLSSAQVDKTDITNIIVSSVVPVINDEISRQLDDLFIAKPIWMDRSMLSDLPITIPQKDEIGFDLVSNCVAAHRLYGASIIIDFGTALTFTTINQAGEILGVAIVPGLKTAIKSLALDAAQLPEVPLVYPDSVLGRNTIHAIQSGILFGYTGLVAGMLNQIRSETDESFSVVATGGLSSILTKLDSEIDRVNRNLTLDGLRFIYEHLEGER